MSRRGLKFSAWPHADQEVAQNWAVGQATLDLLLQSQRASKGVLQYTFPSPTKTERSNTEERLMHAQYTWCSRDPLLNPEEKPHWDKAQPWLANAFINCLAPSLKQFGALLACLYSLLRGCFRTELL